MLFYFIERFFGMNVVHLLVNFATFQVFTLQQHYIDAMPVHVKKTLINKCAKCFISSYLHTVFDVCTNKSFLCFSQDGLIAGNMVLLCSPLCGLTSPVSLNPRGALPMLSASLGPCNLLQIGW